MVCVYFVVGTSELPLHLQSTVTLSTIEAEYIALTEAVKEAIWLQGLMDDLRMRQNFMKVHCDSINIMYLAKNQVYHARTNHIDSDTTLCGIFLKMAILS